MRSSHGGAGGWFGGGWGRRLVERCGDGVDVHAVGGVGGVDDVHGDGVGGEGPGGQRDGGVLVVVHDGDRWIRRRRRWSSTVPGSGATGVSTSSTVSATLSEAVQSATSVSVAASGGVGGGWGDGVERCGDGVDVHAVGGVGGVDDVHGDGVGGEGPGGQRDGGVLVVVHHGDRGYDAADGVVDGAGVGCDGGVDVGRRCRRRCREPVQSATVGHGDAFGWFGGGWGRSALNGAGTVLTFTPSAALVASTTYTAAVSGVKDLAGNAMAALLVVVHHGGAASAATCPCSIFGVDGADERGGSRVTRRRWSWG